MSLNPSTRQEEKEITETLKEETETEEPNKNEEETKNIEIDVEEDQRLVLELGDVIKITNSDDDELNQNTFVIDYIDKNKMKLIDVDNMNKIRLIKIGENGELADGTVRGLSLLSRSNVAGFARQNGLITGVWVNIYFSGEVPFILTGEITNLEEDMIELKTYPECDVIYINFDYKGIPEDLSIESIEIRPKPEGEIKCEGEIEEMKETELDEKVEEEIKEEEPQEIKGEEIIEEPYEESDEMILPTFEVKNQLRKIILDADDFAFFLDEKIGPVKEKVDVGEEFQRYSIESQANDLLDELLSTIPYVDRTNSVMNGIHLMIERYKQLRKEFSLFDSNGNIKGFLFKGADWKPLVYELKQFEKVLYWILPVVKNMKKMCVLNETTQSDIAKNSDRYASDIQRILRSYKSDSFPSDENKYITMMKELNPYFTPFEGPDPEALNSVLYETEVKTNINTIIDNLGDFYSSSALVYGSGKETIINTKSKRFANELYNTGLTHLITIEAPGAKTYNKIEPLTDSDTISIKSFLTLPEPLIRFSRVNLPGTSILERSSLSHAFVRYWQLLKDNTSVDEIAINDFEKDIDLENMEFSSDRIKNYVLELILDEDSQGMSKEEIYSKYLNKVVPKTRILFDLIKKYINGKLTLLEIIQTLEPFMVYSEDITYLLYSEMADFLNEKVLSYNKEFVSRKSAFTDLKIKNRGYNKTIKYNVSYVESISNIFGGNNKLKDNVMYEKYQLTKDSSSWYMFTNSEILRKIILKDYSNLYNSAIVLNNLKYMFSNNFSEIFDLDKDAIKQQIKDLKSDNKCSTYKIVKKYRNIEQVNADNNKIIYYDKIYDDTNYSILEEYEKEMLSMSPDDFLKVLIDKLQKKMKLSEEESIKLAETLIEGHKKVEEGTYAILYMEGQGENYFKRNNNIWVLDETVNSSSFDDSDKFKLTEFFINNQTNSCNVQPDCIESKDTCESFSLNKSQLIDSTYKQILNEFDKKFTITNEKLKEQIERNFNYFDTIISRIEKIEVENISKYNNEKYKMGVINGEEKVSDIPVSPYIGVKNLIMGEQDFVTKQSYIIRFVEKCTRESIKGYDASGKEESPYWLYCNKTGVQLLPKSVYQIANYFISDYKNFMKNVDQLVNRIGASSDNDDSWVDKHCGNVLLRKDFDMEEGYEDGFKIKSREVMEQDLGEAFLSSANAIDKTELPESRMISNIISTISAAMGINLEHQSQFIKRNVSSTANLILPRESNYTKDVYEASKKNIYMPSYKELYNATIMYLSLGMILIGIQTSIPSIKTKKTFPGCAKSFMGYPIEGAGDDSALKYISCIAYDIRNSTHPWSSLMRKKEEVIANKIKNVIDENLWKLPEVTRKVEEKAKYLLETKDIEIPEEYDLQKWKQFLPPLFEFKIKNLNTITPQFKSKLMSSLRTGSSSQREEILVVQSKIIQFSLDIQEKIQNVIKTKKLMFKNGSGEMFTENSCCTELNHYTTIGYFTKENPDIITDNNIVRELTNILEDVNELSKAIYLISRENTKMKYPSLTSDVFDEETIYRAFIVYCNFTTLIPLSEQLLSVCNDKPELNLKGLTIEEQISKLKRDNRIYTNESLLRLLQIVNRNNIVHVTIDTPQFTTIQRLRDIMETFDSLNDKTVNPELRKLIAPTLDTFDVAITEDNEPEEMKKLKNYLSKTNVILNEKIVKFVKKTIDSDIGPMIKNLFIWEENSESDYNKISDETTYNMLNFMKEYIKNLSIVFPDIILNKVKYDEVDIPKYWNLSKNHEDDIQNDIKKYYGPLIKYYDNQYVTLVLTNIQEKTKNLLLLVNETPYFSAITYKGKETYSIFDKRTSKLLIEQYFLMILNEYINICDDQSLIFEVSEKTTNVEEDVFTVEGLDLQASRKTVQTTDIRDEIDFAENRQQLKSDTAKLFISYLEIMTDHKKLIDYSYDQIMDRVFKTKENEKSIMIERLEELKEVSQEMLDVDNIFKSLGLGPVWGKGAEKGLRKFNKKTREEDREFVNKLHKLEDRLRGEGLDETAVGIELEEEMERMNMDEEIDNEVNDISDMNEDYMDGQYNPDDIGNTTDIDYSEYY